MMTSISLRQYNREIESLIEGNQIEEAIANCRQILERYPKHVATYRLLGKAYLEVQRYSDAEDVLQRVLSCIPDDFIAHLGLSIIREEAGDLEAAIWHMERAFDVQPSNAAIQAELRRLYGRRDGTPPVKVTLTRGALARMSARSHLYSQAIGELRAILAEDPQRPDLQVILARLYFQTGQRNAAVETCSSLLNRLPNCLEANRILAEVLPSTERASEAPYYKQRVESIDPYSEYISPDYPSAEQVPDEAVMLDRLVIGLTAELRPTQFSQILETPPANGQEDTRSALEETTQENELVEESVTPSEELPDWMRTAGWAAAAEETQKGETQTEPFVEETPEESEIPEWLRSLAPEEQPVQPEEMEAPEEVELPGWVSGSAAVAAGLGAAAAISDEEDKAQAEEKPSEAEEGEAISAEAAPDEEMQAEAEELPDWLSGVQSVSDEPAAEESPQASEEVPEWLAGTLAAEVADAAAVGAAAVFVGKGEPGEPAEEFMAGESEGQIFESAAIVPEEIDKPSDWVVEGEAEITAEEILSEQELDKVPAGEAGETGQPLDEGEQQEQAEVETVDEEIPGWLQELSPPETEPVPTVESGEETKQEAPEAPSAADAASLAFLASLAPDELLADQDGEAVEEVPPAGFTDTTPDWLKELAGETEPESSLEASAAGGELESEETVPDWLRAISGEASVQAALPEAESAVAELPAEGEGTVLLEEDAYAEAPGRVPDWLQAAMGVGAVEAAGEIPAEPPNQTQLDEPPLIEGDTRPVQLFVPAVEELIQTSPEPVQPVEEIPSLAEEQEATNVWLDSLGAEQEAGVGEAKAPSEEPIPEEGFTPEPFSESEEEVTPDSTELGKAAVAGTELEEQTVLADEGEEPQLEVEALPTEPDSSLAEILAAAGAVYAAKQILDEEQPDADLEAESEESTIEELPEPVLGSDEYEWVEESPAGQEESQPVAEVPPTEETTEDKLPEWLREYETPEPTPVADMEETEWFATAAATGLLDATKLPQKEAEGLLDLNAASQTQLERLPGVGFILAQNILTFREQNGPFTSLDQLEQIPGITSEIIEELRQRLTLTVVPESQPSASEVPELAQAWQRLSAGDIPSAVVYYDGMIQKEQELDEVIKEIQQALALYPGDPSLYQALGDAFLRVDRLQEALEAYDRAEDLFH
jgi:competence ComEA-like helix-hairpin-helix protein